MSAAPVNLFLTKMFFKTSFSTWRNYMKKVLTVQKWEKQVELERAQAKHLGKKFIEPAFPEKTVEMEEVEIEEEIFFEISGSEGEDDDDGETRSKKTT